MTLRVTLNEYASNFEPRNGDKRNVPDAFFEYIHTSFVNFFFEYL